MQKIDDYPLNVHKERKKTGKGREVRCVLVGGRSRGRERSWREGDSCKWYGVTETGSV